MYKVAVLVSGGGTNLQAILDAKEAGHLPDADIQLVVSNKPDAYALQRAGQVGISTEVITPSNDPLKASFGKKLIASLRKHKIDLVVLAGFLVVLPARVIQAYKNRIINVHPSLIPSFCGKGYYGLRVHQKALERGVKLTGATVHIVDEGTDTGPILYQKAVEVTPEDTPESLQARVMEEAEWQLLPQAIQEFSQWKGQFK